MLKLETHESASSTRTDGSDHSGVSEGDDKPVDAKKCCGLTWSDLKCCGKTDTPELLVIKRQDCAYDDEEADAKQTAGKESKWCKCDLWGSWCQAAQGGSRFSQAPTIDDETSYYETVPVQETYDVTAGKESGNQAIPGHARTNSDSTPIQVLQADTFAAGYKATNREPSVEDYHEPVTPGATTPGPEPADASPQEEHSKSGASGWGTTNNDSEASSTKSLSGSGLFGSGSDSDSSSRRRLAAIPVSGSTEPLEVQQVEAESLSMPVLGSASVALVCVGYALKRRFMQSNQKARCSLNAADLMV